MAGHAKIRGAHNCWLCSKWIFAAKLTSSMATLEGDEAFEPSLLGSADEVVQERISDDELILIKGPKARTSSSIILRYILVLFKIVCLLTNLFEPFTGLLLFHSFSFLFFEKMRCLAFMSDHHMIWHV